MGIQPASPVTDLFFTGGCGEGGGGGKGVEFLARKRGALGMSYLQKYKPEEWFKSPIKSQTKAPAQARQTGGNQVQEKARNNTRTEWAAFCCKGVGWLWIL